MRVVESTFNVQSTAIDSAMPLFIGYTEIQPETLPVLITSFAEYEVQFGGPHAGNAVLYYTVKHFLIMADVVVLFIHWALTLNWNPVYLQVLKMR
ncbi:hypothetical protein I6L60_23180 (plasmid) [Enterobacter roggenkampii]|uniref:hypothetical protein n=1 Tax=Enterobacter roggenkampii TaxID=1812935 RepID=UPI001C23039A|nr:hypothetical protein [Enterobacter roggenkampii]QWZ75472.1 hypothetical protein I6L60_23180 [Enterobacter roggenkampii]